MDLRVGKAIINHLFFCLFKYKHKYVNSCLSAITQNKSVKYS